MGLVLCWTPNRGEIISFLTKMCMAYFEHGVSLTLMQKVTGTLDLLKSAALPKTKFLSQGFQS